MASAAKEKLITSSYPDGITGWNFYALGNGYYYTQSIGKDGRLPDKVIRVGDKEIEEWRKTGTFKYTDVESEVDLSNTNFYGDIQDGYVCSSYRHNDSYEYYVMKVDESADKLVKVFEFTDGRRWSRTDGYSFSVNSDYETGVCTYTVYYPDGKKIENTLNYISSGKGDFDHSKADQYKCCGDKYVGYMTWMLPGTVIPGSGEEPWKATAQFDIYGIKKDGSRDVIAAAVNGSASVGPGTDLIIGFSDNYVAWKSDDCVTIYTVGNGKTHKLTGAGLKYGADGTYSVKSVFGSKAVISASDNSMGSNEIYQLVDISGEGKVLLDEKLLIEPVGNGDMFYVSDQYYKAGFFDSTGKKISEGFDNVANFNGDNLYTAAYKDGKACIIDRNMNQVSEMIDARGLEVRGNDFFKYDVAGERGDLTHVLATFANKPSP